MAKFNTVECGAQGGGNTGVGECVFHILPFIGAILTPRNFRIPKATVEDPTALFTFLKDATMASGSDRIYPIHNFEALANDATEQDAGITFGYGRILKVSEGNYAPTYQFYDGGLCLLKALRAHNFSRNMGVLFIDSQFRLIGTTVVDGANRFLGAIPLNSFYAQKVGLPTGPTDPAKYLLDFNFKAIYLNDKPGWVETSKDFDLSMIVGVQDVVISGTSPSNTTLAVSAVTGCANINMGDTYDVELATPSAWVVTDAATGDPVTISSVTYNAATGLYTLTSAAAMPANVIVNLAPAVDLAVVQVVGYEGRQVQIAVTP